MQQGATATSSGVASTISHHLATCYTSIIWSFLDSDLPKSAVFYAERYYALDHDNHDARHIYATTLLRCSQAQSALNLLREEQCTNCSGCLHLKAQTCDAMGRYRQAREALEESLKDVDYVPTPSMSRRTASAFPEEAVRRCISGNMARKGHLFEQATASYRDALTLHPYLWEAFEGLCALGTVPENIDEIFPPLKVPVLPTVPEAGPSAAIPVATGAGFFTPGAVGVPALFRGLKPDLRMQSFRLEPPTGSVAASDTSFLQADDSFLQHTRPVKSQRSAGSLAQSVGTRPLSSADETGPAMKKLRPTSTRQRTVDPVELTTSIPIADDGGLKKARARPALTLANIFSSSGRRSQSVATSSRLNKPARDPPPPLPPSNSGIPTRRSTRLTTAPVLKPSKALPRNGKRQTTRTRSHSRDSAMDDDTPAPGESIYSPPISLIPQSPTSEEYPGKSRMDEAALQEAYEKELAEYTVYNTMRCCAKALRAYSVYDLQMCLDELEGLEAVHQRSSWVMAMVGKAEYEKGDYSAAKRAFESLRDLEPYRIADMEVFSTLLWHTEKHVELSFLAQELLSIEPRSPQAWIAVGNCFSLQKDKKQALTCFSRATQLDPTCAYAYTLSGHELVDSALDQAVNNFQSAIRADPRHYNAWYGLGTCYLRMNKVRLAEYHYRKAAEVHPNNAILIGCIGLTKERSGDNETAIQLYAKAIELCPENALVRYRRGKLLIGMKQYKLAVADLEFLRDLSPDESNVVFQLARVYRLLGDKVKSAQLLAIARDVSPKSVKKIERLLELSRDDEAEPMEEG